VCSNILLSSTLNLYFRFEPLFSGSTFLAGATIESGSRIFYITSAGASSTNFYRLLGASILGLEGLFCKIGAMS
jgi:hypothetical protein